jgi:hypothetical protein
LLKPERSFFHETKKLLSDLVDAMKTETPLKEMVELCGIEPQTSSVQGKRSPS